MEVVEAVAPAMDNDDLERKPQEVEENGGERVERNRGQIVLCRSQGFCVNAAAAEIRVREAFILEERKKWKAEIENTCEMDA